MHGSTMSPSPAGSPLQPGRRALQQERLQGRRAAAQEGHRGKTRFREGALPARHVVREPKQDSGHEKAPFRVPQARSERRGRGYGEGDAGRLQVTPFLIGIAGGTGSGKTTVANAIVKRVGEERIAILSHDSYYLAFVDLPKDTFERQNFDHPDS